MDMHEYFLNEFMMKGLVEVLIKKNSIDFNGS